MKSRYTVLIVGATAVLSWWLLSTEQNKQSTKSVGNHFIDLFINNFTLTSSDKSGITAYTLKATRLEHYNDEDYSQVINPTIHLPQDDSGWLITATIGKIASLLIGAVGSVFVVPLVAGIWWRRANSLGGFLSMTGGFLAWLFAVFAKLTPPFGEILIGLPVAIVLMVAGSLLTAKPDDDTARFIETLRSPADH